MRKENRNRFPFRLLMACVVGAQILGLLFWSPPALGKEQPNPRLQGLRSVFVSGNNQAAEGARNTLEGGKTCLSIATKAEDADGVLAIDADTHSGDNSMLGTRDWIASGTLTLKSGDLVWSHSERFSDAPFKSGGKTAGNLLVRHLADAACKGRK
jgi:hypothetical protein